MKKDEPEIPETSRSGQDVESDPAKGADGRSDWADEGGATPSGPAGATDDS